jgi:putative phage-type endonuclease
VSAVIHEQGSDRWLEQRVGKITGSRAGSILNVNPYSKPKDVLREMVREHFHAEREFQGNEATDWGDKHESIAIDAYEAKTGNMVTEHGYIQHPDIDFIGYSPDGSIKNGIIEVKAPFSQKIPDEIPAHYYAQVQLGMQVMDKPICDFVYWTPAGLQVTPVERDDEWWEKSYPVFKAFHNEYLAAIEEPEDHLSPLVVDLSGNDDWHNAVTEYRVCKKLLDEAVADEKEAKAALIKLANNKSSKGYGLTLSKVDRVGAIDYKKIPEIEGVDLEQYRKKGSTSFRVTIEKVGL